MASDFDQDGLQQVEKIDSTLLVFLAKLVISQNRTRKFISSEMSWGEPSWDLLMNIYVAQVENRKFAKDKFISDYKSSAILCDRYIRFLEEKNMVEIDSMDVQLTKNTKKSVEDWLRNCLTGILKVPESI